MAEIGYQGSDVNTPLGALAARLRGLADAIEQEFSYVAKLGVAGLQAAPYNLDQPTAQAVFDGYGHLHTVARIYFGLQDQAAYNFDDSLALIRGGQIG